MLLVILQKNNMLNNYDYLRCKKLLILSFFFYRFIRQIKLKNYDFNYLNLLVNKNLSI